MSDKQNVLYLYNAILTIKRNKLLTHANTWMNLENMLCKRKYSQKAPYCMIPFILNGQERQIHRNTRYISGLQGL